MEKHTTPAVTVCRQIEAAVREYIVRLKVPPHGRLPSEAELAARHHTTVATVRKALSNLIADRVIYRIHGKGTFLSPRSSKKHFLLINSADEFTHFGDFAAFVLGTLRAAEETQSEIQVLPPSAFDLRLANLRLIHPEISGVIFFRGQRFSDCAETLAAQQIPHMYYGPHDKVVAHGLVVTQNEPLIAGLLANHFAECGFRRAAMIALSGFDDFTQTRAALLSGRLDRLGIAHELFPYSTIRNLAELKRLSRSFDVICSLGSRGGVPLVQALEHSGIRVPDHVAVAAIDNSESADTLIPGLTAVDTCGYENGELCIRRFAEYLDSPRPELSVTPGVARLCRRDTTAIRSKR